MSTPLKDMTDGRIAALAAAVRPRLGNRSIVLIGMMGAGKSAIGRLLARALHLPFVDADTEIEKAAGMSIPDIFETHGEAYFRDGETRVIARLLETGPCVIATGGGAWMNVATRQRTRESACSIWLKAEPEVLLKRVRRRANRPLLKTADPEATLRALLAARSPVYAEADMAVESRDVPHDTVLEQTLITLDSYTQAATAGDAE